MPDLTRRELLAGAAASTLAMSGSAEPMKHETFAYCLNTSTIRGQNLPIAEVAEVASRAGHRGSAC